MILILASSVTLAFDNPYKNEDASWLYITEIVFTSLFSLEVLLRIIGEGFIFHQAAYLRSGYNIIDVVVVLSSIASIIIRSSADLKGIR